MSDRPPPVIALSGPAVMVLSALVFAWFGFGSSWTYYSVINGQFLLFVALLDWTLKLTAMFFGISALIVMFHPIGGNILFAATGLLSAIMLVVVAIMDLMDQQHMAASPILLFIFAGWNGYGAWTSLRELVVLRRSRTPAETFSPY